MAKIIKLSEAIVEKIAAGEVIQNPASVVKELIENSIDAKSKNIKIILKDSGLKKITIIDDGIGIEKEDLELALGAHCTSKIKSLSDLDQIQNLGFRGEALASIKAVSQIKIKSRPKEKNESLGWQIFEKNIEKIGMSFGTVIEVDELFYKTPARKKFLKSKTAELNKISQLIQNFALIYPQISFILKNNEREIFKFRSESQKKRIKNILGEDFYEKLIPINLEKDHFRIKGFIFHPQLAKEQQKKQFIYVNKRIIKNKKIRQKVKEAYSTLISKNAQPAFIIFIDLPENTIDVNIHPQKTEVKFFENKKILEAVFEACQKALSKENLIYKVEKNKYLYPKDIPSASKKLHLADHLNMESTSQILKEQKKAWSPKKGIKEKEILQINDLYLLYESEEGLVIVDQHAAHERILYEEYLEEFHNGKNFQKLDLTEKIKLKLGIGSKELLKVYQKELKKLSFYFKEENKKIYLESIPKILDGRNDLRAIVEEILEKLEEEKIPSLMDELTLRVIYYISCRSAIKANEYLTMDERKSLIKKLKDCQNPYTCPHGRPTQILFSPKHLEKLFHRI